MHLIGRTFEKQQLQEALESQEAELVAVYGRRRVGKTFLVRSFFENKKCIFFQSSGIHRAKLSFQLKEFQLAIDKVFYSDKKGPSSSIPTNWMEAFGTLTDAIELSLKTHRKKIVLFFDEFPWMATHKSGLLEALDYYWNRFWVNYPKVKFIICGSAASWIIGKILNNKGGLHNRVTKRINLAPFSLHETKLFLYAHSIKWNNPQILMLYMAIGGIPYYLKFVEKGLSATQNINRLCFQKGGILRDEFKNLFSSLFDDSDIHEEIIKIIATSHKGMLRSEIERKVQIHGGRLSVRLSELAESGFISASLPADQERGIFYRLTDEYSLFYLKWIEPVITTSVGDGYWESVSSSPAGKVWAGYAFESICFKHLSSIRKALNIPDGAIATSFQYKSKQIKSVSDLTRSELGTQIDLIFDRPDGVVNICEIKYCTDQYVIDKAYAKILLQKVEIYSKIHKSQKQCYISMITSYQLKHNFYVEDIVSSEVTLDNLFIE